MVYEGVEILKKLCVVFSLVLVFFIIMSFQVDAKNEIKVVINGEELTFSQPPLIMKDTTMVPLRGIFEALNAKVNYEPSTKTITATRGDIKVRLTIGSNEAYINGNKVNLLQPALIINDSTLVPVRFISESFESIVDWDNQTQTVKITYKQDQFSKISGPMNLMDMKLHTQSGTSFAPIGLWQAIDGVKYDNGYAIGLMVIEEVEIDGQTRRVFGKPQLGFLNAEYKIEKKFNYFEGLIGPSYTYTFSQDEKSDIGYLKIYGDGELLYDSGTISSDSSVQEFSIDVTNISLFKIEASGKMLGLLNLTFN